MNISRKDDGDVCIKFSVRQCDICAENIKEIQKSDIPPGKIIVIRPDFNSAGFLTNYHIELQDEIPEMSYVNNAERIEKLRAESRMRRY